MYRIIAFSLMGILMAVSLAFAGEAAQRLGDDMYKVADAVIRFTPPAGWEMKQGPVPSMHLNFRTAGSETSLASLGIVACSAPFASGFDVERLMKATQDDESFVGREITDFNGMKAFSSLSEISGLRTKTIQFLQDDNMFTISFVADAGDFEDFLPKIEESLKTFQVVTAARSGKSVPSRAAPKARVVAPAEAAPLKEVQPVAASVTQMIPVPLIAEPYQDKGQVNSVVKIGLKSGTMVMGKVLERMDNRLKVDFHGVPISVYFNDINSIEEMQAVAGREAPKA